MRNNTERKGSISHFKMGGRNRKEIHDVCSLLTDT